MKEEVISKLRQFKNTISSLKRKIGRLNTRQVSKQALRNSAERIASQWVEELRSPLEHKYKIDKQVIEATSDKMKTLHILSRPNNLKSSYMRCLNSILRDYDDKFVLPLQQEAGEATHLPELRRLIPNIEDPEFSEY